MNTPDDTMDRILAALTVVTAPEHAEATREAVNRAIKRLSLYRILELRQRIQRELESGHPEVTATLLMIDGQLILREIAGLHDWR